MNAQDHNELAFAQQYFYAGRIDFAKALLLKLHAKFPQQAQVLELLGYVSGHEGDLPLAAQYLHSANEAKPDNPKVLYYLAYCAQQANDHLRAIQHFRKSLQLQTPFAEGLRNLALSLHAVDQTQESLELLKQAYDLEPQSADILYDYAAVLSDSGALDEAKNCLDKLLRIEKNPGALLLRARILQKQNKADLAMNDMNMALQINPGDAMAWTNLAAILFDISDFERSAYASQQALRIDQNISLAWLNYAAALMKLKRPQDSIEACEHVLKIEPENSQAWLNKAMAHGELLEMDASIAAYQHAKRLGAKASQIDYALAAYGAAEMPKASPADYVTTLFDNYADRFDDHLLKGLEYKVPQALQDILTKHCSTLQLGCVLDLGCGTGLFGSVLKPYATELIGVDLSPKMLAVAQDKAIYTNLIASDILAYLQSVTAIVRLAVALDVFVYIGDLEATFVQIKRLAQSGTEFAFSIEENLQEASYQLLPSLRYAHRESYIASLAASYGFDIIVNEALISRKDRGEPIHGRIFLLRYR